MLAPQAYGVTEDGPTVKLQVGNAVLPMTWDVAIRMAARLRVATRDAREYIGASRTLDAPALDLAEAARRRQAVHEARTLHEGAYSVRAEGPDVVLQVGNAALRMAPGPALNVSRWLNASGRRVHDAYAPDVVLRFHVARLTDGNAEDMKRQARRDATARYAPRSSQQSTR